MLNKLKKYDFLNINKTLVIFYIITIVLAVFTKVFYLLRDKSTILNIFFHIFSGATISLIINILINNIMRNWAHFRHNIYSDEAYLTHTLPVSKNAIYYSKFATSFYTSLISFIVIAISLFISYYSADNLELIKNYILPTFNNLNINITKFLILVFGLLFIEFLFIIQAGFSGLIIGHKFNNNKILFSVIFGFVVYSISSIISLSLFALIGLFDTSILETFTTNTISDINIFNKLMAISSISYIFSILISIIFNTKLLNKGVNLE